MISSCPHPWSQIYLLQRVNDFDFVLCTHLIKKTESCETIQKREISCSVKGLYANGMNRLGGIQKKVVGNIWTMFSLTKNKFNRSKKAKGAWFIWYCLWIIIPFSCCILICPFSFPSFKLLCVLIIVCSFYPSALWCSLASSRCGATPRFFLPHSSHPFLFLWSAPLQESTQLFATIDTVLCLYWCIPSTQP